MNPAIINADVSAIVKPNSHVTLHFAVHTVATNDQPKQVVMSTFEDKPATLQLGCGQFQEHLEQALIGMVEGEHRTVELPPEQAFGVRNPALVQQLSRTLFDAQAEEFTTYEVGDVMEFNGSTGERVAGVLLRLDETGALVDFNHPLAGRAIAFEAKIIGVL
jgi:FKBP-type peptidyl-prolyl cis-trans isomerase SlpA